MKRLFLLLTMALGATAAAPPVIRQEWDGARANNRSGFAERIIASHNAERTRLRLPTLTWNRDLADQADRYARGLARTGSFQHSSSVERPGQGENLWRGTQGAYSIEEMMGHFIDERRDFRPGVFPAVASRGNWSAVSHYTQIIWPTTREVGCAMASRGGTDWLVCRYAPMGNIVGQRVG